MTILAFVNRQAARTSERSTDDEQLLRQAARLLAQQQRQVGDPEPVSIRRPAGGGRRPRDVQENRAPGGGRQPRNAPDAIRTSAGPVPFPVVPEFGEFVDGSGVPNPQTAVFNAGLAEFAALNRELGNQFGRFEAGNALAQANLPFVIRGQRSATSATPSGPAVNRAISQANVLRDSARASLDFQQSQQVNNFLADYLGRLLGAGVTNLQVAT